MAKEEKEIDAENDLYEKGKANFKEALNEWSDVPKAEFEKEREGYDPTLERMEFPEEERSFGYIHDENLENTPEEIAELDEIYNAKIFSKYSLKLLSNPRFLLLRGLHRPHNNSI